MQKFDVVIIGAGASGLMCAIEAGKRGRTVCVLDHANKAGKKILMSGGGRCNFTNYTVEPEHFISTNPHFCKSALSRFTQWDFIAMVEDYQIAYQERSHGQLFCQHSAKDILSMLLSETAKFDVTIALEQQISQINSQHQSFTIKTVIDEIQAESVVVATGGLSIPKMGATPFGYQIAEQFNINVLPVRAGLVPFTLHTEDKKRYTPLSGIAVQVVASTETISFKENMLFTHRGLSGPVILQLSSYWQPGESILINLLPDLDGLEELIKLKKSGSKQNLMTVLSQWLPKRLLETLLDKSVLDASLQNLSNETIGSVANQLHDWQLKPNGTEGYRTAEVTLGGVDCSEISSKTMESHKVRGLYFIGEVLDVTGWLGGYNFQWAWSSGWCAGQFV